MTTEIYEALKHALGSWGSSSFISERHIFLPRSGIQIDFMIGDSSSQPFTVVRWRTMADRRCSFEFAPSLLATDRLHFVAHRFAAVLPLLDAYYFAGNGEPHTWVNINCEDHTVWPGLTFCGRDNDRFLIPDALFIGTRGYAEHRANILETAPSWESRTATALWRGTTTGHHVDSWKELPRIKLCEISRQLPSILDAGITGIVQIPSAAMNEIEAAGYLRQTLNPADFAKWRYQIDIDGNTNSWPGLFLKLLTGSTVLKVESPGRWRQWYYERLVPWFNFVPVSSDLSDLIECIQWLRAHDSDAQKIARRGLELALSMDIESEITNGVFVIKQAVSHANSGQDVHDDSG